MTRWNAQFTQLVRNTRPSHWGNWSLDTTIKPGAVGIVDPQNGEFTLVAASLPGLADHNFINQPTSNDWTMMTSRVSRKDTEFQLDGKVTDPDTGIETSAGLEVAWTMARAGEMVSQTALSHQRNLNDYTRVIQANFPWLKEEAQRVGMASSRGIGQGFGVITSVIYANSGVNVGSESDDTSFSVKGTASGVQKLVGGATGKGSYMSTSSTKALDKHVWPSESNVVATDPTAVTFQFASFEGELILPRWITATGAYQLVIRNNHGGTYIVKCELSFDTPRGRSSRSCSVSGGLTYTFGDIPLDASNLDLTMKFVGVMSSEVKKLKWDTPRGQWLTGVRHVDVYGVWPGSTRAVDAEAGIPLD